jgi:hypothetical protein
VVIRKELREGKGKEEERIEGDVARANAGVESH